MAGVQGARSFPAMTRSRCRGPANGIAVFSMGSVIPESEALDFESAAHGESHTWRATREFALLGEILRSFEWGQLDLLMFDLPPGAERTVQYADFLGPRTSFVLVTIPSEVSRGVVARSVAALSKGPNRVLGYVENMSGYYCRDCNAIKPLFVSAGDSGLGDPLPRDRPIRSRACAALRSRDPSRGPARTHRSAGPWTMLRSNFWTASNQEPSAMKFLCVPCDSPMKLQTVASARARLALGRLLVSRVRLRDGDAHQRVRNASRPVTRRADRSRRPRRSAAPSQHPAVIVRSPR